MVSFTDKPFFIDRRPYLLFNLFLIPTAFPIPPTAVTMPLPTVSPAWATPLPNVETGPEYHEATRSQLAVAKRTAPSHPPAGPLEAPKLRLLEYESDFEPPLAVGSCRWRKMAAGQ